MRNKTFKDKAELCSHVRGCFESPYNNHRATPSTIEFVRSVFRDHLAKSGGYSIVSNGYGQMKEVRFNNLQNPMNAAYLFVGIAAKLTYPLTVEV